MTTQEITVPLTAKEIQEQRAAVQLYRDLINKEIRMGNLMNLENMKSYSESFKRHSQLLEDGYVVITM